METPTVEELQKQIETMTTQLADASKGADEGLRTQLADLEKLNKELIKSRDDAKTAKRQADDKALADNEEYKTLSERLQGENAEQLKTIEGNKTALGEYQKRDEERLATLLESVPAEFKPIVSDEALPLATRIALAEQHASVKPGGPNPRPGGDPDKNSITRAEFDALGPAEKSKFAREGGKVTDV